MAKITLGIDISKAKFDIAVLLADNKVKTKKFENKINGFSALIEWLDKLGIQDFHACMEATGNYGQALATWGISNISVIRYAFETQEIQTMHLDVKNDVFSNTYFSVHCSKIRYFTR
jgi:hypothetical protein